MIDYIEVSKLMAEYFMGSQEAQCLLCNNHMKNITIKKSKNQGCDGSCQHNKEYTAGDLIELFIWETMKGDK